jgi:phage terminase large subunit
VVRDRRVRRGDSEPPLTVRPAFMKKAGVPSDRPRAWRNDARTFVREVCRDEPDDWQDEFLAALSLIDPPGSFPSKPMLALKACKGPGKSRCLAWAIWWWLFTRWHANIIAMSITADNLRDNLWSELARVQERSWALQTMFTLTGERIIAKDHPKTWWCSARSFPQNADKTQQANTIAGLHGLHPAVFCDEVGDYPDGVVVAAEAIFSSNVDGKQVDARLVVAGNPTNTDGPLYRVCTKDRQRWWVKEITGDPDDPKRAKRISREWAQAQIDQWGRENPWVLVNVFGRFPPVQSNKLIGPDDVDEAANREAPHAIYIQEPVIMGMDVARYGDNESVLMRRQGQQVFRPLIWRNTDTQTQADQICNEVILRKPAAIFVDDTGVGGGLTDRLTRLGVNVLPIDFAGTALDPRFDNRRSEMWWKMAEWLRKGGCIPNDLQLRSELIAPTYSYELKGKSTKFILESKKDMVKRGVQSPDRADALALTFAAPVYVAPGLLQTSDPQAWGLAPGARYGQIIGGTEEGYDPLGGY